MVVPLTVDETVLKHTTFATLALLVKFQATNMILGGTRIKSGARPPEDAALFPKAGAQDFSGGQKLAEGADDKALDRTRKAQAKEKRVARLVMNDLENIPLGLIAAWMGVLCGGSSWVQLVSVWAFCVGRCLHSYAYMKALQPWRAIGWGVAFVATWAMAGNAVLAVASL